MLQSGFLNNLSNDSLLKSDRFNVAGFLNDLCEYSNAKLELIDNRYIHVVIPKNEFRNFDVEFDLETDESVFQAKEVFIDGLYNFSPATTKPIKIIDIGSNIGLASLDFLSRLNVSEMHLYEPMAPTMDWAKRNFKYNKTSHLNILEFNTIGLSNKSEKFNIEYSYKYNGSVGMSGLELDQKHDIVIETMQLENVIDVFNKLNFNDTYNILKIDCEGAEYGILNELIASQYLDKFSYVIIEWHNIGNGKQDIINILNKLTNFSFNFTHSDYRKVGMVQLFKTNINE